MIPRFQFVFFVSRHARVKFLKLLNTNSCDSCSPTLLTAGHAEFGELQHVCRKSYIFIIVAFFQDAVFHSMSGESIFYKVFF